MQVVNRNIFYIIATLTVFFYSCQPSNRLHSAEYKKNQSDPIIEEETITSTWSETEQNILGAQKTKNIIYQKPEEKIKNNSTTEIHLGKIKFENLKMIYNRQENKLSTSGEVVVLDQNKNVVARNLFSLIGSHSNIKNEFYLRSDAKLKVNSLEKPITRAKVTCLAVNENDEVDCSHAVVDFFIAYNKQIYTEQIEISKKDTNIKIVDPAQPATTPPASEVEPDVATFASADTTTQVEGKEDSILGRFQGQAETANLKEVFEDTDEEDIDKVNLSQPTPAKPQTLAPIPVSGDKTPAVAATPVKPVTNDVVQTPEGNLRPVNQAIGLPYKGSLRNSTSVLEKQKTLNEKAFFEVTSPERNRHFATYEMSELITRIGNFLNQKYEKKLFVGNISQKKGGLLPPHVSHQIGMDADLAYPATRTDTKFPVVVVMNTRQYTPNVYSIEKTYALFKYAFTQPDIKIDRIFADRTIKKALCEYATQQGEFKGQDKETVQKLFESIEHVDGHGDHFHLRIKCSASDPGCRHMIYSVNKGCS